MSSSHSSAWSRPASEPFPSITPPFDLLLRILSTPPSLPSFDPLQTALSLSQRHRIFPLFPSFLQQLARPLLLLHPRPLQTRSHLFLLPLYVQRSILAFLSASISRLQPPSLPSLLPLLGAYSAECSRHLQPLRAAGDKGGEHEQVLSECHLLLRLVERLYAQLQQPLPACLSSPLVRRELEDESERQMVELRSHATFHWRPRPTPPPASQAALAGTSPHFAQAASPSPSPTPFAQLMRRMCEREGLIADAMSDAQSEPAEPTAWPASLPFSSIAEPASAVLLVDFDDAVFSLPDEEVVEKEPPRDRADEAKADATVEQADVPTATVGEAQQLLAALPPAPLAVEQPAEPPQRTDEAAGNSTASTAQAAMRSMQALLTAVLALQFSVADLQGALTGQLSDEQLRAHPLLLGIIPHVDALRAMSTDAFAAAFSPPLPPTSESPSLTPSSLSPWLRYLLVRLLLTAAVHHSRACLIVEHCIADAIEGDIHREQLLTISHALSIHPAAVFTCILSPPLTHPQLSSLSSSYFGLLRHCLQLCTRADLVHSLLTLLCSSLSTVASSSSSILSPFPSHWSLEVVHLLLDTLPSSEGGKAVGEVAGMLTTVGGRGELGRVDATVQKGYAKVVRAMQAKWPAECARSRAQLLAVCEPMTHFSIRKVVDVLRAG